MTIEKQAPDQNAPVIHTLGELDGVPEGVAVPVKLDGPTNPPYDDLGGALDRAHRIGLKVFQIVTDGYPRHVTKAVRVIASELGYHHVGHLASGRHQPDDRVQKIARDVRLEGHLRVLKLAGLDADDVDLLHAALQLPARDETSELLEQAQDELDERNRQTLAKNMSGTDDATGATWQLKGPAGLHWPVLTLTATLPDGREVTGPLDMRAYVGQRLAELAGATDTNGAA